MKTGTVERDIPYAPEHGAYGLGNLYLPLAATPETPVVLTIHGGGWTAGDRYSWSGVAEYFWRDLGCAVFNIEHRLASQANPWPACGDDCAKAANWLFSEDFRKRAGFSPKKIWICGGSAGGHLALWTALNLPPDKVAGAISISGIADPEADYPAHPGWYRQPFGAPTVTWRDGAIHFITTRVGNYNIRQRLLPFDAARYGRFKIRMRITPNPQTASDGKARRMHLKWGTTENPIIGKDLAVDFESRVASAEVNADAEWHEYEIHLAQDPLWGGKVNELWFEGVDLANAVVDIGWMRFE